MEEQLPGGLGEELIEHDEAEPAQLAKRKVAPRSFC